MVNVLKDGRPQRIQLINRLGELLNSQMLVYFCADAPVVGSQIADDAVRPMYDHVRGYSDSENLALFLYSVGGVMQTPWKIVTMLREFCKKFHVIVPYKAYSAATMIALGADKIWMTRKGELGPIDPSLNIPALAPDKGPLLRLPEIGVEDVASYISFIRHRANLTDQSAVAAAVTALAEHLTPSLLGRIERIHSHIRLVARKLLALHQPPLDDRAITSIVEALVEKIYEHGHGIGWKEAEEIGLDVELLNTEGEEVAWRLFESYERPFRFGQPTDAPAYFNDDLINLKRIEEVAVSCIESSSLLHCFAGEIRLERIRKMPPSPVINVNLNLTLPPTIRPEDLPAATQQAIQQMLQAAIQQITNLVSQELARQAPTEGFSAALVGGRWARVGD